MSRKLIAIMTIIVLASLLLSACGGAAPTPIPPFSKMALDSKLDDTLKQIEAAEKANLAGFNVEMKGYSTTASVDEVTAYYKDALKDWKVESPGDVPAGLTFLKWSKDNSTVFVLMILPAAGGGLSVFTETASK